MKFETYIEKAHEAVPDHTFSVWLHTGEFFDIRGPSLETALHDLGKFHDANWSKVTNKPPYTEEQLRKHEACVAALNEPAVPRLPTDPDE